MHPGWTTNPLLAQGSCRISALLASWNGAFCALKTSAHQPSWHPNSSCWRVGVAPWTGMRNFQRSLCFWGTSISPVNQDSPAFKLFQHISCLPDTFSPMWMCGKWVSPRWGWFLYFHFRDDERRASDCGVNQVTQYGKNALARVALTRGQHFLIPRIILAWIQPINNTILIQFWLVSTSGPGYGHPVDVWAAGCTLHMLRGDWNLEKLSIQVVSIFR